MIKMTDNEIQIRKNKLLKNQRSEWCKLAAESAIDRSMNDVAKQLDRTRPWVNQALQQYSLEIVIGGPLTPPTRGSKSHNSPKQGDSKSNVSQRRTTTQIRQLMSNYAPKKPNTDLITQYELENYTPEVAKCLARSFEAAENAVANGAIKESFSKQKEQIRELTFSPEQDWQMRIKRARTDMRGIIKFLDDANVIELQYPITLTIIAELHRDWIQQIDLLKNHHSNFEEIVNSVR